jgi:acylglycerol lipase
MNVQTGKLIGIGGLELFYQGWLPDGAPLARVLICHGYAEHGGRYAHVAEFLAERGFAVWALDYRGHGRSEGVRAYVERFDLFVEDMRTFLDHVEAPGKTFLYGHSMGALVALWVAIWLPALVDGLVVTGAPVMPGSSAPLALVALAKVVGALAPRLPVMTLAAPDLSHDPQVNARYDSDPLVYRGRVRAHMGAEILRAGEYVRQNLGRAGAPILIMHGTEDRLSDPASASAIYEQVGSEDKTLKMWEGMYHEIHNEPAVEEQVLGVIADWLEARS